jgi:hypothetical protein
MLVVDVGRERGSKKRSVTRCEWATEADTFTHQAHVAGRVQNKAKITLAGMQCPAGPIAQIRHRTLPYPGRYHHQNGARMGTKGR